MKLINKLFYSALSPVMLRLSELDQHQSARISDLKNWFFERFSQINGAQASLDRPPMNPGARELPNMCYLGGSEVLVRTQDGNYLVVPGFNIDVAVGIARDGIIEPWTTRVVKKVLKSGDVYINVGSNFGYYSILGASLVGRRGKVYAIEANPHVFVFLLKSIFWSGFPDVISAYNFAAYSEKKTAITLSFDPQFIGGGSVVGNISSETRYSDTFWSGLNIHGSLDVSRRFIAAGLYSSAEVPALRIDDVVDVGQEVRLLHMDIEGAEADALLGAARAIGSSPNLEIICEWDGARLAAGDALSLKYTAVVKMLADLGFEFYRIETANYDPSAANPLLLKFSFDEVHLTGHCDMIFSRKLSFPAEVRHYAK